MCLVPSSLQIYWLQMEPKSLVKGKYSHSVKASKSGGLNCDRSHAISGNLEHVQRYLKVCCPRLSTKVGRTVRAVERIVDHLTTAAIKYTEQWTRKERGKSDCYLHSICMIFHFRLELGLRFMRLWSECGLIGRCGSVCAIRATGRTTCS